MRSKNAQHAGARANSFLSSSSTLTPSSKAVSSPTKLVSSINWSFAEAIKMSAQAGPSSSTSALKTSKLSSVVLDSHSSSGIESNISL